MQVVGGHLLVVQELVAVPPATLRKSAKFSPNLKGLKVSGLKILKIETLSSPRVPESNPSNALEDLSKVTSIPIISTNYQRFQRSLRVPKGSPRTPRGSLKSMFVTDSNSPKGFKGLDVKSSQVEASKVKRSNNKTGPQGPTENAIAPGFSYGICVILRAALTVIMNPPPSRPQASREWPDFM